MVSCRTCGLRFDDRVRKCPRDGTPLEVTSDPLVGRMIAGRYRLIQMIGTGGMSTVYLARHVVIDRLSAIKVLAHDLARSDTQRERFLREARAVARINHEHIVEISDFGETGDGLVYLVMEYVCGEPLSVVLEAGPLPPLRAVGIVEQVAQALARAHQMSVVHRDIKPDNILLVSRGSRPDFVKVLDFGVAKIAGFATLTGKGTIIGTAGYIAPEQIGGEEVDARADLFSLGVVLYEAVTGHLPFDVGRPSELLSDKRHEKLVPPTRHVPSLPRRLEEVILRALAPSREDRHRDAYHFLMDLTAAATDIPEAATSQWRWGARAAGGTPTLVDVPAFTSAQTLAAEAGGVDPKVLESVLDVASAGSSEGLGAAAFWRFRRDAILTLLEEVRDGQPLPESVARARDAFDEGVLGLCECESAGRALLERIDAAESVARDFRLRLGRAIDVVGNDMSAARGELGALAARRTALQERRYHVEARERRGKPSGPPGSGDALVWELAVVDERLARVAAETDDLEYQLSELQAQLARSNDLAERELELLRATLEDESRRATARSEALQEPVGAILAHLAVLPGAVRRLRALVGSRGQSGAGASPSSGS